jgi:hypothetical protein
MQIGPWQATTRSEAGSISVATVSLLLSRIKMLQGGMGPFFIKSKAGIAVNPFWPSQAGALLLTTV